MNLSIRKKLFAIILFASLVPTSLLGFFSYQNANKALENELKNSAEQSIKRIQESTQLYLNGYELSLNQLGAEEEVKLGALGENQEGLLKRLALYKESNPDILNIYLGTKNKDMYVYPVAELPSGYDPTAMEWYQEAIASQEVIWTEPYVDTGTKRLVVSAAKPLLDPVTNEVLGVVGLDIALDTLGGLIADMKIGQNGYVIFVDQNGKIVTHPDEKLIGEELPVAKLREAVSGAEQGSVDYVYEDDERFGVFDTFEKTHWKFIGVVSNQEIADATSKILRDTIIYCLLFGLVSIVFGFIITNGIIKAFHRLFDYSKKIGSGDLTVRAQSLSRDETGALTNILNDMASQLDHLISNVKKIAQEMNHAAGELATSAEEVMASSEEVSATTTEIARGASAQANQAEEGTHKVMELAAKFATVEEGSKEMVQSSEEAQKANERGVQTVNQLRASAEESQLAVDQIDEVIQNLNEKTKAIEGILGAITSIAQQTNLLALNASIEAAQAGEAGRGFAVVAEEIRKLAEQSAQSVDGIQGIVENILGESQEAVLAMDRLRNQTTETVVSVTEVNQAFTQISQAVELIGERILLTTELVQEMIKGSEDVVHVIQNISAVTEETAASAEEVSASMDQTVSAFNKVAQTAEELDGIAKSLNEELARFKTTS